MPRKPATRPRRSAAGPKEPGVYTSSAAPAHFLEREGSVFFGARLPCATSEDRGCSAWMRSDGTAGGTVLVKDIEPGSSSAFPYTPWNPDFPHPPVVRSGSHVYSPVDDGVHGVELWKSDGTEAGTVLVEDIEPGVEGSGPTDLVDVEGSLWFTARGGEELWRSDGTPEGTELVRDFNVGAWTEPGRVVHLVAFQGRLYVFGILKGLHGAVAEGLRRTDAAGTGLEYVKDLELPQLPDVSEPRWATVVGDILFFAAGDEDHGVELWKSDGTEEGTTRVADLHPGPESSSPALLTDVGGTLYFTADDGANGREPWTSDGTAAGTLRLEVRPGPGSSVELGEPSALFPVRNRGHFAAAGELLVFRANDGVHGEELWVSDGTPEGTRLAADVAVPGGSLPAGITAVGDVVVFAASEPSVGRELFALPLASLVDTDGDGLDDLAEREEHGTDPSLADTDGDGLDDGEEVLVYGTDPLDPDTDGDGSSDGHEVHVLGTDPLDPTQGGSAAVPALRGPGALLLAAVLVGIAALRLRGRS